MQINVFTWRRSTQLKAAWSILRIHLKQHLLHEVYATNISIETHSTYMCMIDTQAGKDVSAPNVSMSWQVCGSSPWGACGLKGALWVLLGEGPLHCLGQLGLLFLTFFSGAMSTQYEEIGFPPAALLQPPKARPTDTVFFALKSLILFFLLLFVILNMTYDKTWCVILNQPLHSNLTPALKTNKKKQRNHYMLRYKQWVL